MSRYSRLFERLKKEKAGAFIPFVTLGDPSPGASIEIIQTLIQAGADALELGLPFSDPLADGPTIQQANLRALASGTTMADCFQIISSIRQQYPDLPIGLLVYANLVFRPGIEAFYQQCTQAGVDSVLIADVPLEESLPFRQAANQHQIAPVFICPPDAAQQTIQNIADYGDGYTYLVSRVGVTGSENQARQSLHRPIQQLIEANAPPAIQGFGISTPEQARIAIEAGAHGVIVGSAIVKQIAQYSQAPHQLHQHLTNFVKTIKQATLTT